MTLRLAMTICALLCCSGWGISLGGETTDIAADPTAAHAPLSDYDLGLQRARGSSDIFNIGEVNAQLSDIGQNANLDHNVAESNITGNNTVSNDAFAGATGFATVIQNSGNNVIIQNATIVNYSAHQ
jgi:hypothetical protein